MPMAQLIDGKLVSRRIREELKAKISAGSGSPGLAVIIVGDDPASQIYVRNKHRACEEVGIRSEIFSLPAETEESGLLELIDTLNRRDDVNGILVQLPLPKIIDVNKVINAISPEKDVDAFHPLNVGRLVNGSATLLPCTPAGVMALLDFYGIEVSGKRCVVIGRSDIVGKPMALLMLHADATVTICHSKTLNLPEISRQADIIVSAVGKAGFLTADMVGDGATVIDVGINRIKDGRLAGDADFPAVSGKASYITPVPGGVGPMTIAMLLNNTYTAFKNQNK